MELQGMIIAALPVQSGVSARTGNTWMSQEYVIEVPGQYPRRCCFKIFGEDRIKQFNILQGETVTVKFDIDAHEYNGRWYNEIKAYDVVREQAQESQAQQAATAPQQAQTQQTQTQQVQSSLFPPVAQPQNNADDLPF